jgi:hypothetical protein
MNMVAPLYVLLRVKSTLSRQGKNSKLCVENMVGQACALRDAPKEAVRKTGAKFMVALPFVLNRAKATQHPTEGKNSV